MSNKYAVIKNNEVINIILWDGQTPYQYPEDGVILVSSEIAEIGDKYENGEFYFKDSEGNWIKRQ